MKRKLILLTVLAAVMAMMVAFGSTPAMAQERVSTPGPLDVEFGEIEVLNDPDSGRDRHNDPDRVGIAKETAEKNEGGKAKTGTEQRDADDRGELPIAPCDPENLLRRWWGMPGNPQCLVWA